MTTPCSSEPALHLPRRTILLSGLAAAGALAVPGASPVQAAQRMPWRSGVFSHDAGSAAQFERTRGARLDVLTVFPTRTNQRTLVGDWWMSPSAVPRGFRGTLAVGLPLFPDNGSLAAAAAGRYDNLWRQMGARLARRYPTAYVRPGWEFNIRNWKWRATDRNVGQWIAAFRRMVVALRAGGPRLRIVWNPNEGRGNSLADATTAWPGNRYVDIVGIDAYDWSPVYNAAGWNRHRTQEQGWDYWARFARNHGKKFAVPEWGVIPGSSHSGGDNPHYITAVMNWMSRNRDILEFEAYFEETAPYCSCALSLNPRARQAYVAAVRSLSR